jgi:hypothetical protein
MGCLCLTFLEEYLLEHGCSPDGVPHTKPAPVRVPETPARWGIPGGVLVLANRQPTPPLIVCAAICPQLATSRSNDAATLAN